jgi:hypothetical protein
MKKFFTLILLSIVAFNAIHAEISWNLSDDGTLTISGTEMPNYYDSDFVPWYSTQNKIKKVIIESGVKNIGNYAFSGCKNLIATTIPNSVTQIGEEAFSSCSSLISITIPNSVTSIGEYAFSGCTSLTSVVMPNSLTCIRDYTFLGCSSLSSITIPSSVTSIGYRAFYRTKWYDDQPDGLVYAGLVIYGYKGSMPKGTNIILKEGTKGIAEFAFENCSNLSSIIIPESVTNIGHSAFHGCADLISVSIPNSITSIEDNTFQYCSKLISITIPSSVTTIGELAFYHCTGLSSVTIGHSVTKIGEQAFFNCSNISSIISESTKPPYCNDDCFYGVNKSISIYVPANSVEAYKGANKWKAFKNIQPIPNIQSLADGELYINQLEFGGCEISYTRTFNNTSWQALYIPFSMNYEDLKNDFEIAYINGVRQLDKDDNGTIDETVMDIIKIKSGSTTPNMPYLIKAKTTGEKTLSVSNATLYPAEENSVDCSTTIAKYTFTGTYNAIPSATMIANKFYAMGGGDLIQSDGSNDLKPYRWYMKVESRNPSYNASNAAKTITINVLDEESETTGVEELRMANDESLVYDLNGRKVNENNLKPGIYVKNGKKFVVK